MAASSGRLTGGSLCNTIRFECTEPPCDVLCCHCRLCQRAYSNVFAVLVSLPTSALSFTRGTPQLYRPTPYAERGFCSACGTPLTFRYLRWEYIAIAIGSLDRPDAVRPEMRGGIESQAPWLSLHDDLPRKSIESNPEYMAMR